MNDMLFSDDLSEEELTALLEAESSNIAEVQPTQKVEQKKPNLKGMDVPNDYHSANLYDEAEDEDWIAKLLSEDDESPKPAPKVSLRTPEVEVSTIEAVPSQDNDSPLHEPESLETLDVSSQESIASIEGKFETEQTVAVSEDVTTSGLQEFSFEDVDLSANNTVSDNKADSIESLDFADTDLDLSSAELNLDIPQSENEKQKQVVADVDLDIDIDSWVMDNENTLPVDESHEAELSANLIDEETLKEFDKNLNLDTESSTELSEAENLSLVPELDVDEALHLDVESFEDGAYDEIKEDANPLNTNEVSNESTAMVTDGNGESLDFFSTDFFTNSSNLKVVESLPEIELEPEAELEVADESISDDSDMLFDDNTPIDTDESEQVNSQEETDLDSSAPTIVKNTNQVYLIDSLDAQQKAELISDQLNDLKLQLNEISQLFFAVTTSTSELMKNTRELESSCADDFLVTYEQMHDLKKIISTVRKELSLIPNMVDVVDEALETDLYTAQTRNKK